MTDPATRVSIDLATGATIERIVVPVTLDERYDRGVSAAATFAERFGFPVLLVRAEVGPADAVDLQRGDRLEEARTALVAAHPAVMVEDLLVSGPGDPAETLASHLQPSDLVILATGAVEGATGSFAQHLASHSGAPVMMLGPDAQLGDLDGDVLVAVDGSVLAERCIPAAAGMAAALGSDLKLVEAVSSVVSEHISRLRERGERVSENAYIRDLVERLGNPAMSWEVVHGDDPAIAVADAARRGDTAMIVMSTHGRDGFVAQVFGSIALDTVRHASCPVLVQRPVADAPAAITA